MSIILETSSPKENPDFPAADEDNSLLNVEEKLPDDKRSQLMTPSDVNWLQIILKIKVKFLISKIKPYFKQLFKNTWNIVYSIFLP